MCKECVDCGSKVIPIFKNGKCIDCMANAMGEAGLTVGEEFLDVESRKRIQEWIKNDGESLFKNNTRK